MIEGFRTRRERAMGAGRTCGHDRTRGLIRRVIQALALAGALAILVGPRSALAGGCATVTSIGSSGTCGIVIGASGCYKLAAAQNASSATAVCIVIQASNVYLNLAAKALTGTGASDTGTGIHVLATNPATATAVSNVTIAGQGSTVTKFGLGVLVEASKVRVEDVGAGHNNVSGIKLSSASGCVLANDAGYNNVNSGVVLLKSTASVLSNLSVSGNGVHGIWLSGSSGNTLTTNIPFQNGGDGIHLDSSGGNSLVANGNPGDTFASTGQNHNGIVLNFSNGNKLVGNESFQDKTFGLWIRSSSGNLVSNEVAETTGVTGIYFGCSATGPKPSNTCTTNSTNNRIQAATVVGTNSSNVKTTLYGIALDAGSSENVIAFDYAKGDVTDDLRDNNTGCGTNTWFGNTFTTSNPSSCIH